MRRRRCFSVWRAFAMLAAAGVTWCGSASALSEVDAIAALETSHANGVYVYQLCADCHTPQGWGMVDGTVPVLAGQHRRVLIKQVVDIRDGHRDNEAMFSFAQDPETGSDQSIADVTGYIARLPIPPTPGVGPGEGLEHAGHLYRQRCAVCHGSGGEGDDESLVPRLWGQHYGYLKRQMARIASGTRDNADPRMVEVLRQLEESERDEIADYLSRQQPEPELVAPRDWQNPDFNFGIQ